MSDIVTIGDATLYCGDCLDVLPTLDSVPAVITDPPYEAEAHTLGRRTSGERTFEGGRTVKSSPLDFAALTDEMRVAFSAAAASVCDGWLLTFCQAEAVAAWREAHECGGAKYRRAMVWIKPDGLPQFSGDRPAMGYESIVASWCGSGKSVWNGGGRLGVFNHSKSNGAGPSEHMTQKPIPLMQELVLLFSNAGDIVLDRFMGSGTTGVACAQLGRKFIGIEIERKYFDIACERVDNASRQQSIFPNEQEKPCQDSLPL